MSSLAPPRSAPAAADTATHPSYPLVLRGVSKRWRAELPLVLDGLDLTLEPGTRTWIGGRNGVGKTTLLRIAAGLIEPDTGTRRGVGAHGARAPLPLPAARLVPAGRRPGPVRPPDGAPPAGVLCARISMVPRAPLSGRWSTRRSTAFELGELAEQRVDRMSMGQRQRLRIAMTFLPEPEVVLLDEPLTSLDAEGAALLERAVETLLAREGARAVVLPERRAPRRGLRRALDARARKADTRHERRDRIRPRVPGGHAPRPARVPLLPHAAGQPGAHLGVQPHALLLRLAARAPQRLHDARRATSASSSSGIALVERHVLVLHDPRTRPPGARRGHVRPAAALAVRGGAQRRRDDAVPAAATRSCWRR